MDAEFVRALLSLLTFYLESAAQIDTGMVTAILQGMLEVIG